MLNTSLYLNLTSMQLFVDIVQQMSPQLIVEQISQFLSSFYSLLLFYFVIFKSTRLLAMANEVSSLLFLELIECLKNIEWSGWVRRGLLAPKSMSNHMYRMAIMC
jgi:hypothetical protein